MNLVSDFDLCNSFPRPLLFAWQCQCCTFCPCCYCPLLAWHFMHRNAAISLLSSAEDTSVPSKHRCCLACHLCLCPQRQDKGKRKEKPKEHIDESITGKNCEFTEKLAIACGIHRNPCFRFSFCVVFLKTGSCLFKIIRALIRCSLLEILMWLYHSVLVRSLCYQPLLSLTTTETNALMCFSSHVLSLALLSTVKMYFGLLSPQ